MADLDPGVLAATSNANFKTVAEKIAVLSNMGLENAISHQKRLDVIAETALAKALDNLNNVDVGEGLGIAAAQRGDLAKQVSDLAAAVASMQAMIKTVQTVPPVTA